MAEKNATVARQTPSRTHCQPVDGSVYGLKNVTNKNFSQTLVEKSQTITNESDGITTIAFDKFSENSTSQSYYYSVNHLFYNTLKSRYTNDYGHFIGNNAVGTGSMYVETNPESLHNKFVGAGPQYKSKFYDKGVILSLSSSITGDRIKPGTFVLEDNSNGTNHKIWIKDDKYGNLYASGSNYQISQSNTSVSSSDNYVGNIFYDIGMVVITETEPYKGQWHQNDVTSASYASVGPSMTTQNNLPHGIWFKPDGTRYYMIGSQGSKEGVYEYEMSTPWEVSSATYTGNSLNLAPHFVADAWRSVSITPEGTKVFLTNQDNDTIKAWDLDSAWDLSSFDEDDYGSLETFDLDGGEKPFKENKVKGHYFRDDGLKLYVVGETNNSAIEYNLSTAFDLTSITGNTSQSYDISSSVSPVETEINGIHFKPDGTRMYTGGNDNNVVYEHRLSTAWDVTTATLYTSKSINSEDTQIHDVKWSSDGSKMYIVGHGSDRVHQYNIPSQHFTGSGESNQTNYTASFNQTRTIKTWKWTCAVEPHEFNFSMNPTIIPSGSWTITEFPDSRRNNPVMTGSWEANQFVSYSIADCGACEIPAKFRTRNFQPYITKIGLYNDCQELLCVAALPQPVKKLKDQKMVFEIQMDF